MGLGFGLGLVESLMRVGFGKGDGPFVSGSKLGNCGFSNQSHRILTSIHKKGDYHWTAGLRLPPRTSPQKAVLVSPVARKNPSASGGEGRLRITFESFRRHLGDFVA